MTPDLQKALDRLQRSTWDNRVVASQHDVRILLNAMEEALSEYNEPMSCLTSAERGEVLADAIATLARAKATSDAEGV